MQGDRRLYWIWICCAVRLIFYASMLPLWEGFDEWAHFAVIRAMAVGRTPLPHRDLPIPKDVAASMEIVAMPWEQRSLPVSVATQDGFWKLLPEDRSRREAALRDLPRAWRSEDGPPRLYTYEALQPPLYYWLMTPFLRLMSGAGLAGQVMAMRWISALIASLAIPFIYAIARTAFDDAHAALGCAAIAALMPEWAIEVARVGNDCLSVVLFSLLIWLGLRLMEDGPLMRWVAGLGFVLGLGLLTKAWFLAAIPAIVLLYCWMPTRARTRGLLPLLSTGAIAVAISGWWYVRNLITTGTLTGLSESVMLHEKNGGSMLAGALRVPLHIPWTNAIDSILVSHIYFGGWSSLTIRSWGYRIFYALIALACIGLFRIARQVAIRWLLAVYLSFWAGQLYNVVLIWMTKGMATSMGWYLYAVVAAEVVLCVAGLRAIVPKRAGYWAATVGAVLFGLLDLYAMHTRSIPYYTGLIAHRASGTLAAFHWSDLQTVGFGEVFRRLAAFKSDVMPWPSLVAMWIAYLIATLWLMSLAWKRTVQPDA